MSLQKIFGYAELIIGVILIFGVIIGSYFVFSVTSNIISKGDNIISSAASNAGFEKEEVSQYKQSLQEIIPLLIYSVGGVYLLIFLLIGILFSLQGILNIREE